MKKIDADRISKTIPIYHVPSPTATAKDLTTRSNNFIIQHAIKLNFASTLERIQACANTEISAPLPTQKKKF